MLRKKAATRVSMRSQAPADPALATCGDRRPSLQGCWTTTLQACRQQGHSDWRASSRERHRSQQRTKDRISQPNARVSSTVRTANAPLVLRSHSAISAGPSTLCFPTPLIFLYDDPRGLLEGSPTPRGYLAGVFRFFSMTMTRPVGVWTTSTISEWSAWIASFDSSISAWA